MEYLNNSNICIVVHSIYTTIYTNEWTAEGVQSCYKVKVNIQYKYIQNVG